MLKFSLNLSTVNKIVRDVHTPTWGGVIRIIKIHIYPYHIIESYLILFKILFYHFPYLKGFSCIYFWSWSMKRSDFLLSNLLYFCTRMMKTNQTPIWVLSFISTIWHGCSDLDISGDFVSKFWIMFSNKNWETRDFV